MRVSRPPRKRINSEKERAGSVGEGRVGKESTHAEARMEIVTTTIPAGGGRGKDMKGAAGTDSSEYRASEGRSRSRNREIEDHEEKEAMRGRGL